jgi:hypothetical protein
MSFGGVPWLFFSPGQIGIGEASPSKNPVVRFGGQLGGSTTRGVFTLSAQVMRDVTTAARGYATYLYTEPAPFKTGAFYHFLSEQGPLGAQSAVDTQFGFTASSSLVGAITNYGFFADLPAGTSRWNFYSRGTADSWFASNNFIFANGGQEKARFDANGYLLLGRGAALPVTAAKLQISGTANLSVVAYNDNTAAIGAGLVPGDIYRKPDGTLMIAY